MNQNSDKSTKKAWRLPESALLNFLNLELENDGIIQKFSEQNFPSYSQDFLQEFYDNSKIIQKEIKDILEIHYSGRKLALEHINCIRQNLILAHPSIKYVNDDYARHMHETGNLTAEKYENTDSKLLVGTMVFHRPETRLWYELMEELLRENRLVICENCGAFRIRRTKKQRFCSTNCRVANHLKNKK